MHEISCISHNAPISLILAINLHLILLSFPRTELGEGSSLLIGHCREEAGHFDPLRTTICVLCDSADIASIVHAR